MEEILIKRVTDDQVDLLLEISRNTFVESFAAMNSEENMRKYLEEKLTLSKMKEELSDPHSSFFFAWNNQEVVGYLKLNFGLAQTELRREDTVEIERIYVAGAYQGKGLGKLLFDKAVAEAKQAAASLLWLGVWEKNYKALAFYEKIGFTPFGSHIFRLGEDEQTDILMQIALKS